MKNSYISKPVHWRIIPSGEETSIPPINTIFYPLCYPTQYNTTMVHCQSKLHQASLALITSPTFTMKKKKVIWSKYNSLQYKVLWENAKSSWFLSSFKEAVMTSQIPMITTEYILNTVPLNESENLKGVNKWEKWCKKQKERKTKTYLAHPTNFNCQRTCPILNV